MAYSLLTLIERDTAKMASLRTEGQAVADRRAARVAEAVTLGYSVAALARAAGMTKQALSRSLDAARKRAPAPEPVRAKRARKPKGDGGVTA